MHGCRRQTERATLSFVESLELADTSLTQLTAPRPLTALSQGSRQKLGRVRSWGEGMGRAKGLQDREGTA